MAAREARNNPISVVELGPDRIIRTADAGDWCDECHKDAKSPYDEDFQMYEVKRLTDGKCICCGGTITNGVFAP